MDTLDRYIRGDATTAELEAVTAGLDLVDTRDLCDHLELSMTEYHRIHVRLYHLAEQLWRYLCGDTVREEFRRWVSQIHGIVSSAGYESSAATCPTVGSTLRLLSFLLDENHPTPSHRLRASLTKIHGCLEDCRPVPMRTFLPSVFHDMGAVRLRVLENPLVFSLELRNQWLDVGLMKARGDEVRLIPFSVFTRFFFQKELPQLIARFSAPGETQRSRNSEFSYHPENNLAISLAERYPALRNRSPGFQYYVDGTGLAEIVLDTCAIRRREVLFATKLFCLQNRIRRATLDGRRVSGTALSR